MMMAMMMNEVFGIVVEGLGEIDGLSLVFSFSLFG